MKTINYYGDRWNDLMTYKGRGDNEEFECLVAHLDRYLARPGKEMLHAWLKENPLYDYRNL